jgi:hypothetical protein
VLDHIDGIALRARWAAQEAFLSVNDEAVLSRTASGTCAKPVRADAPEFNSESLSDFDQIDSFGFAPRQRRKVWLTSHGDGFL